MSQLEQTLRQLMVYDVDGLPVLSADGNRVQGWVTDASIIGAVTRRIHGWRDDAVPNVSASAPGTASRRRRAEATHPAFRLPRMEVTIQPETAAAGAALGRLTWPPGFIPVSVRRHNRPRNPDPGLMLSPGDRIVLLARGEPDARRRRDAPHAPGRTTLAGTPGPVPTREGGSS